MAGMAKHVEWSPCGWAGLIYGLVKNLGCILLFLPLSATDFYGIKKAVVTVFTTIK